MTDLRKLPLTFGLPAALFVALAATIARTPTDSGPQGPEAPIVAVVDIDRVLKSYPGAEAKQQEWKAMEAGFQGKMEDLKVHAQEAAADRESFDEGTEQRALANMQYELKRLEYEETGKIFSAKADQFRLDIALQLYGEIQQGVASFAKQKGIRVVFRARNDNPALPKAARLDANQQREVMFFDPAVDMTDDVIRYLKTWKPEPGK